MLHLTQSDLVSIFKSLMIHFQQTTQTQTFISKSGCEGQPTKHTYSGRFPLFHWNK